MRVLAAGRVEAVPAGRLLERGVVPPRDRVRALLVHVSRAGCRVVGSMRAILLVVMFVGGLFQGRLACVDNVLQIGV